MFDLRPSATRVRVRQLVVAGRGGATEEGENPVAFVVVCVSSVIV
jgi:hypothetical protein